MPQGARRPHKNQFASLQGWGQEGHHHLSKLGVGFNGISLCQVLRLYPPHLCYPLPIGLSQRVGKKSGDKHHLRWHTHCTGWILQQCQGPRCPEPGALSAVNGWEGDCVRVGGASIKAPPNSHGFIPRTLPTRSHSWIEVVLLLWGMA